MSPTRMNPLTVKTKAQTVTAEIVEALPEWQAEAGQLAQTEQDSESYKNFLSRKIYEAICAEFLD